MKISEQIKKLQELKDKYGDVDVYTYLAYDQCYEELELDDFMFEPAGKADTSMYGDPKELPDRIVYY